jgi:hypothetical protein
MYPALASNEKGIPFTGFRLCACCKVRESRGLGWFDPRSPIAERIYHWACSLRCQEMSKPGPSNWSIDLCGPSTGWPRCYPQP